MSIELTSKSIGSVEVYYDNYVEQGIDCDVTLPDYCPDIMRILKCSVHNNITNSKISGDRATADGNAKIKVIYADEKNRVFCYEQEYPFSKYAELSTAYDNAVLVTNVKTEYANCRAVSKRRVDIHGVISLHFKVCSTKNETLICDAAGDGIQLKKKGIDAACAVAVASKTFQLSEVESVGDGKPGIGKILYACASPILSETKIIKGKILLKGELAVKVIYCADSGENETCMLGYNLPFNEIVEAENVTDECKVKVCMNVNQIDVEPKTDNDGEYRYFNLNAEVTADITAYSTESVRVITDAYSTDTEIDAKYRPMEFMQIAETVSDSFMCRENLDIASMNPQKIYAVMCGNPEGRCHFDGEKMTVNGKIPVNLIIIDADGAPMYCEREAPFEYSRLTDMAGDSADCTPQLYLSGYTCTLTGDGKAEFKAEMNVSALIMKNMSERVMVTLQAAENSGEKKKKPSLTIYFCSGGESVWDIARKYNTTVEEIMEENNLTADYLENKSMLMIPVK